VISLISVYDIDLASILPESLKQDEELNVLIKAISQEIRLLFQDTKLLTLDIDSMPEEIIDFLAVEKHVDFYDRSLPIEKKRELVKNSYAWHRHKGTPWAVDQVVSAAFDDSEVSEWFEYGGEPFHFKVTTTDRVTTEKKLKDILLAIDKVKNKRSRLESITIRRDNNMNFYVGGVVSSLKILTINPAT